MLSARATTRESSTTLAREGKGHTGAGGVGRGGATCGRVARVAPSRAASLWRVGVLCMISVSPELDPWPCVPRTVDNFVRDTQRQHVYL